MAVRNAGVRDYLKAAAVIGGNSEKISSTRILGASTA